MDAPRGAPDDVTANFGAALLERAPVLAAAERVLGDCGRGNGRLFVVGGPAGIGKTSVLAEARSRAFEAGMEVLHASASELERAFSYGVVRQLFEPLVRRIDDTVRERLFEGAAMHARLLFDPRSAVGVASSEDEMFAVMHGLYWLTLNV